MKVGDLIATLKGYDGDMETFFYDHRTGKDVHIKQFECETTYSDENGDLTDRYEDGYNEVLKIDIGDLDETE